MNKLNQRIAEVEKEMESLAKLMNWNLDTCCKHYNEKGSSVGDVLRSLVWYKKGLNFNKQAVEEERRELLEKIERAYIILENNRFHMKGFMSGEKREQLIRDIDQREDEIFLIYSDIEDISVNKAKEILEQLNTQTEKDGE